MMKNFMAAVLLSFSMNSTFAQEINTLLKLENLSAKLGNTPGLPVDTLLLESRAGIANYKMADQLAFLLSSAEYYSVGDYHNSMYYLKKVVLKFKNDDYNSLKCLLLIGNASNLKDIKETARYYYMMCKLKCQNPKSLTTIGQIIRNNFDRNSFDEELSRYFYYHQRLRILNEIGFAEFS
jgi:hypothetical protein